MKALGTSELMKPAAGSSLGSEPRAYGGQGSSQAGPQALRLAECGQTRPERCFKAREQLKKIFFANVTSWSGKAKD